MTDFAWMVDEGYYESALVYAVDPAVESAVRAARDRVQVPLGEQIRPHLTVCYLGRMRGWQKRLLWSALSERAWPHGVEAENLGLGSFGEDGSGKVSNIHLVLRSPVVDDLHRQALDIGRAQAGFAPGPYVGPRYKSHLSILDQVELDEAEQGRLKDVAWPPVITLGPACLISRRMDPVEVCGLGPAGGGAVGRSWGHHT